MEMIDVVKNRARQPLRHLHNHILPTILISRINKFCSFKIKTLKFGVPSPDRNNTQTMYVKVISVIEDLESIFFSKALISFWKLIEIGAILENRI